MFPTVSQLDSFTDVFGDEFVDERFSQPLSLPTTCDSTPQSLTNGLDTNVETIRPPKHTGQHGEFRSIEEIDPKYRCLFTYPYFNLVQSRIIEDALYSDKSLVVCAPTGSGKTVVFELAILQLLMQIEDQRATRDFKIIYMAPVKAVCNERLTEWYPKLTKLGLLCIEVTGDTEVDFSQLAPYKVIITTPEKWDILTRRWRDHRGLVEMIKLFLIDEVHILNDEMRGPVLEAVVSRMKTVESAAQSAHRIELLQKQYQGTEVTHSAPPHIRFVAVSATVSNPEDVADWLGTSEKPAVFHKFGDECRPVKLQRIVEGYPCAEGTSIFKFDLILNYKLWPIIQKYYNGKPTLIFCNTRKSVSLTAEALSREVTVTFSPEQKAKLTALASTLKNKKLQMLVMSGVGCHHAGLLYEERVNIEQAFRNRDLPILITTTTLAMGVNLPAHLVIVKNTQQYVKGAYQEYSISTVLQMVGRAGRPQFDTEATAVIMTRLKDKPRYQALVGGMEPLQSYLHKRLAENLNSEAALGTVTDVAQCVEWLRSTFLYVRAARDPKRYLGLPPAAPTQLILKKLEELCVKAMNSLASSGLITMDEASCIESTEAGRLMSLFYMDVETMKNIMKIEGTETLERLLWLVCESHELSDMHLRMDERRCLNLLNRNNKAATIRFPMKGKISTRQMKLNCIIQATLGCLPIPDPSLNQEAMKVMKTAARVCNCLVKYVTRPEIVTQQPQHFAAVLNSIVLNKCIEAHLWENSPYVSKQLKGIGPTFSTLLASAGVTSFMLLEESHPRDLERIMNKGPPAGNIIRKQVSILPKYQLNVTPIDSRSISIQLMLLNHAHLSENMNQLTAGDNHKSFLIVGDSENHLILLTQFKDTDFISVYDGTMKFEVTRKVTFEHKILIHCVSSVIVGIDTQADYLFLDLEPQSPRENDYPFWSNPNFTRKNVATKQTALTDVYKERKRKYNCDNDITQCKEKKKRESTMVQKLQALKESFSKTSKAFKSNIDKSVAISKKAIHELLDGTSIRDSSANFNKTAVETPTVDLTQYVASDPLEEIIVNDDDDYIDDLQIDSILNKIESEISGNDAIPNLEYEKGTSSVRNFSGTRPIQQTEIINLTHMNKNRIKDFVNDSRKSIKESKKHKNINRKTNYSIIDLIEKKEYTEDVDKIADKENYSGFSDTIKCQLNKFLEQAQHKTKIIMPEIDELMQTAVDEELPEVHVKTTLTSETNAPVHNNEQDNGNYSKSDNSVKSKKNAKVLMPVIDELIQKSVDEELPEVYVSKCTRYSETNAHVNNGGHDNDSNSGNSVQSKTLILQENVKTEEIGFGENLDSAGAKEKVEIGSILIPHEHVESPEHVTNIQDLNEPDIKYTECNGLKASSIRPGNIVEESNDIRQNDVLKFVPLNANSEGKSSRNDYNDVSEKNNQRFYIACDEPLPIKAFDAIKKQHDSDHRFLLKSLIPSNIHQHAFIQDVLMMDNQSIIRNCNANYSTSSTNSIKSYNIEPVHSKVATLKTMANNEISTQSNFQPGTFPYNHPSLVNSNGHLLDSNHMVTLPTASSETVANLNKATALLPYDHKIGNIEKSFNREVTYRLKSLIPDIGHQKAFRPDRMSVDKFTLPYQYDHQIAPSKMAKLNASRTDIVTSHKMSHQSSISNLKPLTNNERSIQNNVQRGSVPYKCIVNRNELLLDTKHPMTEQERNDSNQHETYFKRFSYTATKVDVCTKKYSPDHELRITRKLKVDVDVTEVVKQDKSKTNNKETNKGDTEYVRNNSKQNNEIKNVYANTSPNICIKNEDINLIHIDEDNCIENDHARKKPLESIEEKPVSSATNNSIEKILQKYRNILAKPNTQILSINKTNQKLDISTGVTKATDASVPRSKKPFRISEINAMNVPLPENLTNVCRAPTVDPIETGSAVKVIKTETQPQNLELFEPININSTPNISDYNDKSYESYETASVHSLKLDPLEDIKDESMFNPKLLLQYCTEGDTDIIAPPAPFSDNTPVDSPGIQQKTELYENFDLQYSNDIENMKENFYSPNNVQYSPKEIETWCLSRDDEYDTYASQPVSSRPWISQRAHNSQGLGSQTAKLCQFKFVRKKSYRH